MIPKYIDRRRKKQKQRLRNLNDNLWWREGEGRGWIDPNRKRITFVRNDIC